MAGAAVQVARRRKISNFEIFGVALHQQVDNHAGFVSALHAGEGQRDLVLNDQLGKGDNGLGGIVATL